MSSHQFFQRMPHVTPLSGQSSQLVLEELRAVRRADRQRSFAHAISAESGQRTVFALLAGVFACFAALDSVVLEPPLGMRVVLVDALLAVVFGSAYAYFRDQEHESSRWARWSQPSLAVAFVLVQMASLHTMFLFDRPLELVFVCLTPVAFAAFSGSTRWFAGGTVGMVAAWIAFHAFPLPASSQLGEQSLGEQSFYVFSAVFVAVVIFLGRRENLVRLGRSLRLSETTGQLLENVLDGSHDLIQSVDPQGRVLYVNTAWALALGVPANKAVGRHISDFVHEDSPTSAKDLFQPSDFRAVEDATILLEGCRGKVHLRGRIEPLFSEDGQLEATRSYFLDVTAERHLVEDLRRQEELLCGFAEASEKVFWIHDLRENRLVFVNAAAEDLTGYPVSDFTEGRVTLADLLRKEEREHLDHLADRVASGERWTHDHIMVDAEGDEKWVRLHLFPLHEELGQTVRIAGISEDITERKRQEIELETSRKRLEAQERVLRQFVENTPAAVAMFDTEMRYLAVSNRWREDYDLHDRPLIGEHHYDVFPNLPETWKDNHRRALSGETSSLAEVPFERPNGRTEWLRWKCQPWTGSDDEVGGLLIFTEMITESKLARDELEREARTDSLTGAFTRSAFWKELQRLWSRREETGWDFAVFYLDLDDFKEINDTQGHGAGDDVLVEVVDRLRRVLRLGDLVGRFGGDEIVAVAREISSPMAAEHLAIRLRKAIGEPVHTRVGPVEVSASMGIVMARDVEGIEELIEKADGAMYVDKQRKQELRQKQAEIQHLWAV